MGVSSGIVADVDLTDMLKGGLVQNISWTTLYQNNQIQPASLDVRLGNTFANHNDE